MSVMQSLKKRATDPRKRFKEVLDKVAVNEKINVSEALFEADSS